MDPFHEKCVRIVVSSVLNIINLYLFFFSVSNEFNKFILLKLVLISALMRVFNFLTNLRNVEFSSFKSSLILKFPLALEPSGLTIGL
jgi:hypothetical protein